jgi:hypothetical protein
VQQKQLASPWERDAEEQSNTIPFVTRYVGGCGRNENWSMDSMLTALMKTIEAFTMTFKDDSLEIAVILHWMKIACVIFLLV